MEHNRNHFAPEAASDDDVSHSNPSNPRSAPPGDGLISDQLNGYLPVATDGLGRRRRCDGFTPDRQVVFLDAFARCGVAADAARAAGISRDTAYSLRNSAAGRAFALGWDAAVLISRGRMADVLESRALNGVVDKIYRNGELWGERHRHDNRLAMAVLTRLDRQADGFGEGAATARIIAREWDQFLDIVEDGGDGAGDFLASRASKERDLAEEARTPATGEAGIRAAEDLYHSLETFERLFAYSMFGGGLEGEDDLTGLEPAAMESWTDNDWLRADRVGLLDSLGADEWPETVREASPEATNGTCRSRQDIECTRTRGDADGEPADYWTPIPRLARARREYRRRFPDSAPSAASVEPSADSDITPPNLASEGGIG
jgi:hypothetical protein